MIRKTVLILSLGLLVAACGQRVNLSPKAGNAMPVKPEGAPKQPTAEELMTPNTQAKPKRSDEQLKRSEERRDDKFDLPPE
jgi:hypothetical protein